MTEDKESALHDFLKESAREIAKKLSKEKPLDFLDVMAEQEGQRAEFISKCRRIPFGMDPFLVILRKWNSYTPSLPSPANRRESIVQHSIGGGYFLFVPDKRWELNQGYGLVIDPGYNFIHNFGLTGFCLDDIDGILITHAHNDHTNDFESLLALLYERNRNYRGDRQQKKVDLFLNVGAFKKFSNYLDLSTAKEESTDNCIGNVVVMSPGQSYYVPGRENALDLEIIALYTNHDEIVTAKYALGICLKVSSRNIYITGDTGWTSETASKNEELLQKHGIDVSSEDETQRVIVLISHLGSMERKEFEKIDSPDWKEAFYRTHLGVLGTLCMVEKFKPALCIVSEFGEELADLRIDMAEALESQARRLNKDIRCLPGDVGLWIFPLTQEAICYVTEKKVAWKELSCELSSREKSVIYVDRNSYATLGDAAKESNRASLKCERGLQIAKKLRRQEIIQQYELDFDPESITKEQIVTLLSSRKDSLSFDPYDNLLEDEAEILLLSTFDISSADLINCSANDFLSYNILAALESLGYVHIGLLRKYFFECGDRIGEGLAEWDRSITDEVLYRHLAPKMQAFMAAIKLSSIDEATRVLREILETNAQEIFDTLNEDEKIMVLVENRDDLIDYVDASGKYSEMCQAVRRTHEISKWRRDIETRAFAIVKPEFGCPSGYPTVREETLLEVLEREEDEVKKQQLSELLTELRQLEVEKSRDGRLTDRCVELAIELMTGIGDVIGYLNSMLADDKYADKREKIQDAIDDLRSWPEQDIEMRKLASLDISYKGAQQVCGREKHGYLRSIDPSYFVPKLRELLMKDISHERRQEIEALIKEIEARE